MKISNKTKTAPAWLPGLLCAALAALGIVYFAGYGTKQMTLLAGLGILALLAFCELKPLKNAPALLLIGYVVFSWVTVFWAMSGKFHLREFSKILIALLFFLYIALRKDPDRAFMRRVTGVISGIAALYAFMSVEAAATGVCRSLLQEILPSMLGANIVFDGSRLYGIFGNSNIEASIYAIGILFSVALLCGSEKKWQRIFFAVTLSFCSFAFLLVFSMGAVACFAAAVVVYLIAAGKGRSAALLRMLEAAVPTVMFAFFAARLFAAAGAGGLAVVLMLANAAVSAVLELAVASRLSAALTKHQKAAFGLIALVAVFAVGYAMTALRITGEYTFGNMLDRTLVLEAGEHTLQLEADGDVSIRIFSKNRQETMKGEQIELFSGAVQGEISFTVPGDTEICKFWIFGEAGTVLKAVSIDKTVGLPLRYKLLPEFIANRVQNLSISSSAIQREVYRKDAIKLFRLSPVVGSGVGSFETGITAVQDYPYESKYVHNHYIQILLEDGVIGFALYAASLLAMAAALWKKRKLTEESELRWIYPALCAEFVMNGAQMLWDVSMSMIVFLCMSYATHGLIVGLCAEPIGKQQAAAEETAKNAKRKAAAKQTPLLARIGGITLTALFLLTLCGNLYAQRIIHRQEPSIDGFLGNLKKAVAIDLYEHNDAKLSYVTASVQEGSGNYLPQANRYAAELSRVQSNTIPSYLAAYYLQTGQYEAAIDEAMLGAAYSATDADTWNANISLLKQAFLDSGPDSPLLIDGERLMPGLMEYYNALQAHNAAALVPVELSEEAQAFFDKVLALNDCAGDTSAFRSTLLSEEGAK